MAVLHQLPIIYLVQDNDWGISATGREMRAMDAYEFAAGFKGLQRLRVDGADFAASYASHERGICAMCAHGAGPCWYTPNARCWATTPVGVRREWYRGDNLAQHTSPRTRCRACTSSCF